MERTKELERSEEAGEDQAPVIEYNLLPWMVRARKLLAQVPNLILEGGVYTGKTSFGAAFTLSEMFENPGDTTWWPAPEDWHIRRFWEEFRPAADAAGAQTLQTPHCFARTPRGSTLHGVTTKNLKAIASYHPHRMVCDEVSKMTQEAFNLLRVRMLKAKRVILMANRGGRLWERIRRWGIDKRHGKWAFIQVPTPEAGLVTAREIEMIKADIPLWLFVRDFLCGDAEGEAKVFKSIESCAKCAPERPSKDVRYTVTYDPADSNDYGFATVWSGLRQVWSERWQETGYRWQARKVVKLAAEYNTADIIFDQHGVGVPVGEMMREELAELRRDLKRKREEELEKKGLKADDGWRPRVPFMTPVEWDNTLKTKLVNDATTLTERGHLELIDRKHGEVYATFIDEHRAFERTRSKSGLVYTYQAPTGEHDDAVSTTLLLVHGTRQPRITVIGAEPNEKPDGKTVAPDSTPKPRLTRL